MAEKKLPQRAKREFFMSDAPGLFADGRAYERLIGRWSRLAGAVLLDWLALPKGLQWLDVGCGNGAFTEVLIAHGEPAEVTGIDPSEGQLSYARTRPGAKLAQFRTADAQALPFANDSFDAAIMALVITFVPDPAKAVAEMARVVRPGGCVATYMWDNLGGGLPLEPINRAMRSLGIEQPNPPGLAVSRQDTMRGLWEQAGLQSVEARVIRIPITYSGFDDFWDSNNLPVGPAGKAIHELSPAAREQLKAHLRQQLPEVPIEQSVYSRQSLPGRCAVVGFCGPLLFWIFRLREFQMQCSEQDRGFQSPLQRDQSALVNQPKHALDGIKGRLALLARRAGSPIRRFHAYSVAHDFGGENLIHHNDRMIST